MEAERFDEACPKLEESLRLDQGIGTQFNLAHCWEKQGRTASAWALFLDVAAAARASNQEKRETAARERASALEPKLTRLRITLSDPPPDAKVSRDDQDVGRAAWGTAMPVDPGDHTVVVTAAGKQPWSQTVKVPANSKTFSVTVPALEDAVVAKPAPVDVPVEPAMNQEPARDAGGGGGSKVAVFVVGGVGVAALATGTIFALQSRSHNKEALTMCHSTMEGATEETCASDGERDEHDALVADAKREQTIGLVAFGVGGAALVTAVILYATSGGSSDSARSSSFDVTPLLGSDGWGAALSGRF